MTDAALVAYRSSGVAARDAAGERGGQMRAGVGFDGVSRPDVLLVASTFDADDVERMRDCAFWLRGRGLRVTVAHTNAGGAGAKDVDRANEDALASLPEVIRKADRVVVACSMLPTAVSPAAQKAHDDWRRAVSELVDDEPSAARYTLVAWGNGRSSVPAALQRERIVGLHRPFGRRRLLTTLLGDFGDDAPASSRRQTRRGALVGDEAATRDIFEFRKLAETIAKLIKEAKGPRPRTVSVEAPWGGGKTTFLGFLVEAFERLPGPKWRVVRLSPWRFDKSDGVWADFAQQIELQLGGRWTPNAWLLRFELALKRFNVVAGMPDLGRLVLSIGAIALAIAIAFSHGTSLHDVARDVGTAFRGSAAKQADDDVDRKTSDEATVKSERGAKANDGEKAKKKEDGEKSDDDTSLAGLLVALLVATPGIRGVSGVVRKHLSFGSLAKHVEDPKYETHLPFLHTFHEDLERLIEVYAPGPTLVVIDDLDRCEIPIAAELFQAISLMIPANKNLTFVVAFDRDKVAAAIAARHDKLLPMLAPATEKSRGAYDPTGALEYGQYFLQKFVHVPIRLPRMTGRTLGSLAADGDKTGLVELVASVLDHNPRRIKHFLNAMLVYTAILDLQRRDRVAVHDGAAPARWPGEAQLAKFIAMNLRWPVLIDDIGRDPTLLTKLEELALDSNAYPEPASDSRATPFDVWRRREELLELLRSSMSRGDPRDLFMAIDIGPLLAMVKDHRADPELLNQQTSEVAA